MRTTVTIDDSLLDAAKKRAVDTRRTLSAVIEDALRSELARDVRPARRDARPRVVTFRGKGLRPGVNLDSTSDLVDRMEDDR